MLLPSHEPEGVDGDGCARSDPAVMNAAAASLGTSSASDASLQDVLTLILTTSPSPICPSTEMIETVLDSMAKHAPGVSDCRLIIVCDGAKVGGKEVFRSGRVTEASWASYAEYKQRLHARIQTGDAFGFRRAEVLELTEHHGFGFAVYAALQLVRTRLLCVVQHDRALLRPVRLAALCEAMLSTALPDTLVGYVLLPTRATEGYPEDMRRRLGVA